MRLFRCYIGQYRDNTFSAQGQDRYDLVIISGIQINGSVAGIHDICHMADISGCFFDSGYIFCIFCKISNRRSCQRTAGTARYVVQDRRYFCFLCDGCIMFDQSVLCAFIIVRSYQKNTICSCFCCLFGHLCCSCSGIGAGTCNNRDSVVYLVNGKSDRSHMFFFGECRRFACCSADHNGICASCDLFLQ